ncbi:MAG: pilin, partial [Pseudomonadota bacterium]
DTQRIDTRHALATVSWTASGMNHRLYGAYIELLQYLADVAEADVDVWSMPTADALGLPRTGTLGLRLAAAPERLTGELTFEHNPIEFLGGATGIATVGILAAIAIPAYQDYTVRAQVGSGLLAARPTQDAVGEFYRVNGRFPGASEAAALAQGSEIDENVRAIVVEPDSGGISVELADDVAGGGHILWLVPEARPDGGLHWRCTGSLEEKSLPGLCRDGN